MLIRLKGAGGGLAASHNSSSATLGSHVRFAHPQLNLLAQLSIHPLQIFLIGLILQLVSFAAFFCIYLIFLYRVRKGSPRLWFRDARMKKPRTSDWRSLALALFVSCIGVLVSPISQQHIRQSRVFITFPSLAGPLSLSRS